MPTTHAPDILERLRGDAPTIVEVGVGDGTLAEALLLGHSGLIWHGVDPWRGRANQPEHYLSTLDGFAMLSATEAEHLMQVAQSRIAPFGSRATIHRTTSIGAASQWKNNNVDMVFIDGDHSTEAVREDIAAWRWVLMQGGLLGGHDYGLFGVKPAVDEFVDASGLHLEFGSRDKTCWFVG